MRETTSFFPEFESGALLVELFPNHMKKGKQFWQI